MSGSNIFIYLSCSLHVELIACVNVINLQTLILRVRLNHATDNILFIHVGIIGPYVVSESFIINYFYIKIYKLLYKGYTLYT